MKLEPSPQEAVRLVYEVERRFETLAKRHVETAGVPLEVPGDVQLDRNLFRRLYERHGKGDFRHTLDEVQSMERLIAWVVEVNRAIIARAAVDEKGWGK